MNIDWLNGAQVALLEDGTKGKSVPSRDMNCPEWAAVSDRIWVPDGAPNSRKLKVRQYIGTWNFKKFNFDGFN